MASRTTDGRPARDPRSCRGTTISPSGSAPTLYQIPFTAVSSVTVDNGGSGYTSVPKVSVPNHPEATAQVELTFGKSFETNGAISATSYTLVLSRLDKTMTTLMLGEMAAGGLVGTTATAGEWRALERSPRPRMWQRP